MNISCRTFIPIMLISITACSDASTDTEIRIEGSKLVTVPTVLTTMPTGHLIVMTQGVLIHQIAKTMLRIRLM